MRCLALVAISTTLLFGLSKAQKNYDSNTLMAKIDGLAQEPFEEAGLSMFRDALQAIGLLDEFLGDAVTRNYTVFAPTNGAIKENGHFTVYMKGLDEEWHFHLKGAVMHHIVTNATLLTEHIFDLKTTEIQSMQTDFVDVSQWPKNIGGAAIIAERSNLEASNGVLHIIDKVLQADFMDQPFSQLELQSEYGPDDLDRVAMADVVDFVGGRETLNQILEAGQTFVGCNIRAFNRLDEYLPWTLNDSLNVTYGEFLNETFREETRHNFIEYNLIPKNYYYDDIPDGFTDLTVPVNQCGHMWVTKNNGQLCFNNGCVVETPELRTFLASNG
jgi:uncharacterized surface protein with fasciclin (FAS1) repeats